MSKQGAERLIERYFEALQAKIAEVAAQAETIRQAAELCAEALARGGAIHLFDSGHMVSSELVHRAGGLAAFSGLSFGLNVNHPVKTRTSEPAKPSFKHTYIEHVFEAGQLRPGDVLIIGSVSGKTANVVELALQARAHGLRVIAVTALAYSARLASEHPSGKRLFEAAELTLDNGAPYGDGILTVEGLDHPICPASGLGAAGVLWAMTAGIVEELLKRGLKPTVYPSINLPGGGELVAQAEAEALRKGY